MVFTSLEANRHIYEPICICDQDWVKFPLLVFVRHGVHKVFGTHRLRHSKTHSLTDGQTRMQYASLAVFKL